MAKQFTNQSRAHYTEIKKDLIDTVIEFVQDEREARLYTQSIKGIFNRASKSIVGAADQVMALARRLDSAVVGPLAEMKPDNRDILCDKLNDTWLGFMGELVAMGREDEVVEISRTVACHACQNGKSVKVASELWSDIVTKRFKRDSDVAKGMIVAGEVLSEPLDWTFRGVVNATAKALNLNIKELAETTPARTAVIHSKNYINPTP